MEKIINPEERWPLLKSTENSATPPGEEDIDDEEEALSLCDLPQTHHSKDNDEDEQSTSHRATDQTQDNFDFCFSPRKSEMCAADEVFFQGQILPLSRSISSKPEYSRNFSMSISRSESMDRYSSSGLISSRSSSISSGHSSTSGSGSGSSAATDSKSRPPKNPFQYSHPSPSPRLRNLPNNKRGIARIDSHNPKKSSSAAWNVFRLGLLTTPPEIAVHDLKNRPRNSTSRTNFGSRNSTSTNSSSSTTKKKRMLNPRTLLSACKCTFGAVDTVPSKVVVIKRSASDSECEMRAEDQENNPAIKSPKKRLSNHRTFEWLKQLSLEGAATDG